MLSSWQQIKLEFLMPTRKLLTVTLTEMWLSEDVHNWELNPAECTLIQTNHQAQGDKHGFHE